MAAVGAQIKTARTRRKISQGELGERLGLTPQAISHYETGKRSVSIEQLDDFAKALQVNKSWLLTGEGEMEPHAGDGAKGQAAPAVQGEMIARNPSKGVEIVRMDDGKLAVHQNGMRRAVQLVEYDVTVGGGAEGLQVSFKVKGNLWVDTLQIDGHVAHVLEVIGDSMEPDFLPGEKVIVVPVSEEDRYRVPRDGVYVFRMEDAILIKRLTRMPGSMVRATSRNEEYAAFDLDLANADFEIIGRVYGKFKRY